MLNYIKELVGYNKWVKEQEDKYKFSITFCHSRAFSHLELAKKEAQTCMQLACDVEDEAEFKRWEQVIIDIDLLIEEYNLFD